MSERKELNATELEGVAGGVALNNSENSQIYKCGLNSGEYTHSFSADRYNDVYNKAVEISKLPGLTAEQKNQQLWDWMQNEPGLLTKLN